jgi:hypothetical protein
MQDAAWAIGLFGGIPAALIFLPGGFVDGTDEAANLGGLTGPGTLADCS